MKRSAISSLLLSCLMGLSPQLSQAEDIDVTFMTVQMSAGQSQSVMLNNQETFVGPRFFPSTGVLHVNDASLDVSDIQGIRFELRQVDAIREMENGLGMEADGILYHLSGQKLGHYDVLPGDLPKGIYIWNGRKIMVK